MNHKRIPTLWKATALVLVAILAVPWVAFADNVKNDVATTHPSGVTLIAGDPESTAQVGFYVQATQGNDGDSGCNLDGGTESLTLSIKAPNGISASPARLTFTACDQLQYAAFAANLNGVSGEVSVEIYSNTTGSGEYNLNPAKFQIVVTAPPSDTTPPTAAPTQDPAANANGWNNTDVTVTWNWADEGGSGIDTDNCTMSSISSGEGDLTLTATCMDLAGNVGSAEYTVEVDKTAPTASASASPAANANGWNNSDVTVSFSGSDGLSGIDFCDAAVVLSSEGAGQSASGTCTDKAGNVSASAMASGINIDKTAPTVSLVGGPADGGSYYFGFVPAAPTCSASDVLSGLDGACSVSGYSAAVGSHTVTASATDKAGNLGSPSASYTVLAWTLKGFYQPVDMNGVYNLVKNGSTVPLKFEIFAGTTELTDVAYVKSLTYAQTACDASATTDEIETVATGGTVLRYDATAGQFVYNWKTPSTAGKCYRVTMTTQDGSSLVAYFKLK